MAPVFHSDILDDSRMVAIIEPAETEENVVSNQYAENKNYLPVYEPIFVSLKQGFLDSRDNSGSNEGRGNDGGRKQQFKYSRYLRQPGTLSKVRSR